jgi:phospholipase C
MGTWPARSPDLIRLDFSKFDFLKTEFLKKRINNLQELMALIILKCNGITPDVLQHIFNNMKRRVVFCMQENGGHFQHLL